MIGTSEDAPHGGARRARREGPDAPLTSGSLAVLLAGMFVVMVGFGIIIPVMPFYVLHFGASSIHLGLLMALYSTMQFIFAPLWGAFSDRVGRKPVLLVGLAGFTLSFVIFALATRLWMLFAARALAGVLSSATMPAAMAYVSDSTSEENRGGGMGAMGAAMGLGMIFGPAVGGLMSKFSIQAPFMVAAAMAAVNLVVGFFFLPESLRGARRPGKDGPGVGGREGAAGPRGVTFQRKVSRWDLARGPLLVLFALAFAVSFAMAGFESTFALYLSARLGFGSSEMGVVFTAMGVVGVLAQGVIVGRLIRRFGEGPVVRWGLVLSLVGLLLTTRLRDLLTAIAFASLFSFGNSLTRPSVSSLVSKKATTGQGVALGAMQSFDSLGRIVGPLWGGVAFYLLHDLPYFSGAAALALGFGAAVLWRSLLARPAEVTAPAAPDPGMGHGAR